MEYILLIVGAIFINNVILSQFLGICPFLGVSSKVDTSIGMSGAVMFVLIISTMITYLLYHYLLAPLNIAFMQTICFILVIASLVQLVEIILKKVSPALFQALGIFLPLMSTNCAVLGVAILAIQKNYSFTGSLAYAVGISIGYGVAMVIFAGIREQMDLGKIPAAFKGVPIALITAGILAMAFMGFAGVVKM